MKIKNLIATALLAAGLAAAASAQTVSVGLGDLVLGFNKSSSTGSTSNVEVTLGAVTNFKSGGSYYTPGTEVFLSQLSVADLNGTYGTGTGSAGWKATGTTWAVVGTNGAGGGNTLWSTQVTPENAGSSQGAGANQIATMYTGLNGKAIASTSSSAVVPTANADSWKSTSSGNFGYFGSTIFRNNSALATPGASNSLNLYEYVEGSNAYSLLGTFKLYDTGSFSFTAIPEPSTYAALLGVVTLGVVAVRRRRQVAQEAAI